MLTQKKWLESVDSGEIESIVNRGGGEKRGERFLVPRGTKTQN